MKEIKVACLILFLIAASLMYGCTQEGCNSPTGYTVNDGIIMLDKEGTISCELCKERGVNDRIIVLESEYCGACKAVAPNIKEAAEELGAEVLFLDLSKESDSIKMNGFGVMPYYTPTMLVGCDVYIGGKSKEEYKQIIGSFLS
jgi:thiol-disulfide isomerase/thioredoxin